MSGGGERARRRIVEIEDRLDRLRRGERVTDADIAAGKAHAVEAAERAEAAGLNAAARWNRGAEIEDSAAGALAERDPDRAQQHRERADHARQNAESDRKEAAGDRAIADRRRNEQVVPRSAPSHIPSTDLANEQPVNDRT